MRRAMGLVSVLVLVVACGDDAVPADAGLDLGADLGRDAGMRDLGPMCARACVAGEGCCPVADGGVDCVNLSNDAENCGACGVSCAGEGLGTRCFAGRCQCGDGVDGCNGTRGSTCCPVREGVMRPYCANFDRDLSDCDGCGLACDPRRTDRCSAGNCYCGSRPITCAGTPENLCCADAFDEGSCVDTRTSLDHCGGCGIACTMGEACVAGVCTRGATCAGGCAGPDAYCCEGVCCARDLCMRGFCGPDAGM